MAQVSAAEEMRKIALRVTRSQGTEKLIAHVAVSSSTPESADLVVDEAAHDSDYLDGNVLLLRFKLAGKAEKQWTRISRAYVVEDGGAFEYVALMHGQTLAAVTAVKRE